MRLTLAALVLVPLMLPACGPPPGPPPTVARETPADHVQRIGKVWEERALAEGFMSQPNDIDSFRIETRTELKLDADAPTAKETLERTEEFKMRAGRVFHCTSTGATIADLRYDWSNGEAKVTVRTPSLVLRRTCTEPGYPYPDKRVDGAQLTYVLRGDRLIAVEPPLAKSTLIPIR